MANDQQRCWPGYEPVPGKAPNEQGSCRPKASSKLSASEKSFRARRKKQLADWKKKHPGARRSAAQNLQSPDEKPKSASKRKKSSASKSAVTASTRSKSKPTRAAKTRRPSAAARRKRTTAAKAPRTTATKARATPTKARRSPARSDSV